MSSSSFRLVATMVAFSLLFALAGFAPVLAGAEDPVVPIAPGTGGRVVYHTVERGQTVWSIADRYGSTVDAVIGANAIADVLRLPVGARLAIPLAEDLESADAASSLPPVGLHPPDPPAASGPPAPSGAPAGVDRLLERGEVLLRQARFEAALSSAGAARKLLGEIDSGDAGRQVRLELLTATAEVALGHTELALVSLERALREDPSLALDPRRTSPKVMEVFESATSNRSQQEVESP